MMSYLQALTQIGFTEYEAKIYLALLAENPATGYQISKKSGVPRSMVYETLSRLAARGAVLEAVEERSTLYRPLPPGLLIDQYEADYVQLVDLLREGLDKAYRKKPEASIWSITGVKAALSYAVQMIRNAEQEIYLVVPDQVLEGAFLDELRAASKRAVNIRSVLTGAYDLKIGEVVYHPPVETELHGLDDTLMIVVDNAEVLITDTGQDSRATITRNPNLVMISRQFVWMELFTQRIYAQSPQLLEHLLGQENLFPEDRAIFESLVKSQEAKK